MELLNLNTKMKSLNFTGNLSSGLRIVAAENRTNPFRHWDGRDHIKAAHAKKAAQTYKQHLKKIRRLSQNMSDWALYRNN
ncbi:MAG TPA: hypothetical protein DEF35_15715 [Paenibacillus sp.]|nr:hypothetical protein CA599_07530 [Paenibacillus taichungensis]HBU83071.1 hypothetical protein [Paenibacillus sp.]